MTYVPRVRASKGRHVGLGRMQPVAKISIIIPAYNAEKYLGETIESVLSQTMPDWELVLVDDGSTDATASIGQAYAESDGRVRVLRQPNGRVANARNNGFAACFKESSYLLFLDADDCLEPEMLAVTVRYLDDHPEVGMVHTEYTRIDSAGNVLEEKWFGIVYDEDGKPCHTHFVPSRLGFRILPPTHAETPFVAIYALLHFGPSFSVIRRSVYERTPGWDETLGQPCEDNDMFLQVAVRSKVHYISQLLGRYRRHSAQSTRDAAHHERQLEKLYQKWLIGDGLTAEQKALVKQAWHFREGRLIPGFWFIWGCDNIRAGNAVEGIKCYLRMLRQLARYAVQVPRVVLL